MNGENLNGNESTQGIIENSNLNQPKKYNVYHAIYIPPESEDSIEEQLHVYTDKDEALQTIKKYRSGRLKTFKSRLEAEQYAKHGSEKSNGHSTRVPTNAPIFEEKTSSFKGLKPQELVAFRKLIENGDLEAVKKTALENPRYLISSGDTPAILQEGCRYNALHIASSKGSRNVEMCKLILDTVSDPEFVALHYGKDDSKTYVNRAQVLLDLYLNTPDKGLNETPLHFAAKYGLKDVVKLLVSYSQCIKTLKNKYDQIPMEIICMRRCQNDEILKKDIKLYLEDQYYVPVLRSEDNTIQPQIGQPFSPTSPPRQNADPISPRVEVRAFAGPMTKPQAMEFRKKWKTPPRLHGTLFKHDKSMTDSPGLLTSPKPNDMDIIRLKDTEKGLERVGRNLAEEYSVAWKEFWPFLDEFTDLRDDEGLAKLEKYLMEKVNAMKTVHKPISDSLKASKNVKKMENNNEETDNMLKKSLMSDFVNELNTMWDKLQVDDEQNSEKSLDEMECLIKKMQTCSLNTSISSNSESSDKFYTPPDTPELLSSDELDNESSDDEMFYAEEGDPVFIEGKAPGKIDCAVLNAIPNIIGPDKYPFIYQWKHEMNLAMSKDKFLR
ncbi:hypothetical protein PV327_006570 [Microctonus hyperodae]|uniref:ANKLE2 third alpha/beta domain-containing protein n=1 Tax=Microctonus hyperodae TaxID=165561 RepID=A0AA39F4P2_MICHY|nr:hypothetical protein PV327_006570 [Microctonus hyperodae]